ncbi:MAG: enoyl-CoA hydratase/isomerase family protein, partial [Planctomycetota bacterium]
MATCVQTDIDGPVATLGLVSDAKVNVLSSDTCRALDEQVRALSSRPDVRVWIVAGSGTTFLAGADIREMARLDPDAARDFSRLGNGVMTRLAAAPAVTIAAVNGAALGGGCELAMACDLRVMADDARIGLPETTLGIIPGWGGTQRLARLIGAGRAKEMIFTGRKLSAEQAHAVGLVNRVAPAGEVLTAARELAERVLAMGPDAVRLAKQAIDLGLE